MSNPVTVMDRGISAKIIADSISPNLSRLTTWELEFPRFVLAQITRHRVFSFSVASSRAIPTQKLIDTILTKPAMPVYYGENRPGMVAINEIDPKTIEEFRELWLEALGYACDVASKMNKLNVHKQIVNRILEPWMTVRAIVSGTEFDNFYKLRCHDDAQPELAELAYLMRESQRNSIPTRMSWDDEHLSWHIPYVDEYERRLYGLKISLKISTARCARVSYMRNHEKTSIEQDIALHDKLVESGHWSPLEHIAQCVWDNDTTSNFSEEWKQYRKVLEL